eukprot:CAMPEP_0195064826 /NCGR_PEP_ID=MMETSP0448-20130528/10693_1 /TAXON_ID=66468 /ORGANISM="Heterocapsa triquestra, Strain CCMP 448" /LENGTH=415 /DNA_ID=CAMNT_0040095867 /DNA_START=119 /DNA_END=1363 /DNA_ORIENTATION=+
MARRGAQELPGIVDEGDEERRPPRRDQKWDWDNICSYKTFKIVNIRDRYLGGAYWITVLCVVMITVIFIFHIDGRHTRQDPGLGTAVTRISVKAHAKGDKSKIYDEADLRFPAIEPAGAFLMTRRIVQKDQARGSCVNFDSPKTCPCDESEVCNGEYCEQAGWCPSLGDANVETPPAGAEVEEIEGLEDAMVMIGSGIAFPYMGNYFFVNGEMPDSTNRLKNILLKDLLALAQPPLTVQDVQERGAVIGVSVLWECQISAFTTTSQSAAGGVHTCGNDPSIVVKRLDSGQGFVQKRVQYKKVGGAEQRDAHYVFGIRLLVDSAGIGRMITLDLVVIQLGAMFSLLKTVAMFADWLMMSNPFYIQERRDAYYKCKVQESEDFSDLKDRIPLVKQARQIKRPEGGLSFGLGAGGRGG